jgi:hypothetical protein
MSYKNITKSSTYLIDNYNDINFLPPIIETGTEVFCLENNNTYIKNNAGKWVIKQSQN